MYVGDMYLPASDKDGKNIYLATVIDVYSRKLVGHALADHMRVSLVIEALSHARKVRGSLTGAIFHSDYGSVYTSQAFRDHCAQLGVRQSMGAVGTSADNALAESFNEVPRVLFLGICLVFHYCLLRGLLPKFGFHLGWGSVSQALVEPYLVPP